MTARPPALTIALICGTISAGLTVRLVHLGLPPFVVKYGGSTLWALMIYWIVSTILASQRTVTVVLATGLVTTAVEFGKLLHTPALDSFRLTLPGMLLLGRIFSVWDIVAYWFAIAVGVEVDRLARRTS
jgi:hypothetical protein